LLVRYLCCFLFSSRRRHTRFSRDWSSDVCSSDLPAATTWWTALTPPSDAPSGQRLGLRSSGTGAPGPTHFSSARRMNAAIWAREIGRASCREIVKDWTVTDAD